ncbi:HutD family protein [Lachnospiraceae bacterium 54-53]
MGNKAYTVVKKEDMSVSQWSSGTTTEIYIYPEHASYAMGDFSFRISAAEILDNEAVFTPLSGVHRIIMPITGPITLFLNGGSSFIEPFHAYAFNGGLPTRSKGKGRDLNLMMINKTGNVETVSGSVTPKQGYFTAFYPLDHMTVHIRDETITIDGGDFFINHQDDEMNVESEAPIVRFEILM